MPIKHILVEPFDDFVGRDREIQELRKLLLTPSVRLVTVTGVGGVGKTRLSCKVANDVSEEYPDGVEFVDLSRVTNHLLVPTAIAEALGIPRIGSRPAEDAIIDYLKDLEKLIVLDNMEHVVEANLVVSNILSNCRQLVALVTSREPLRLSGEVNYHLEPLEVPSTENASRLEITAGIASVDLFIRRVRAINGRFTLTSDNVAVIGEICRRLDGIPLAIELAAVSIRKMSEFDLHKQLARTLDVLADGARDRPHRQRTLRLTIEWTFDLLQAPERRALAHLSVFVGGFAGQAAVVAIHANQDIIDDSARDAAMHHVGALIEHGLIRYERTGSGHTRFTMLETIRQFGLEQLRVTGEEDIVRWSIARYYLRLAEEARPALETEHAGQWLDRLEEEIPNIRWILEWLIGEADDGVETALSLCIAIWQFWKLRNHVVEGKALLWRAVRAADDSIGLPAAKAFLVLGNLEMGDPKLSEDCYTRSLTLFKQFGDLEGQARASSNLGMVALQRGDLKRARNLLVEALGACESLAFAAGVAATCYQLGRLELRSGRTGKAKTFLERARETWQQLGDFEGVAYALLEFGRLHIRLRQPERAAELLDWSRRMFQEAGMTDAEAIVRCEQGTATLDSGDVDAAAFHFSTAIRLLDQRGTRHDFFPVAVEGMARVALRRRQLESGVTIFGAIDTWRRTVGYELAEEERRERGRILDSVRMELGSGLFESLWLQGTHMQIEHALELSQSLLDADLSEPAKPAGSLRIKELTNRERQILCLIAARGLSNQDLADILEIKPRTVTTHVDRILGKLAVDNRTAAAAIAFQERICDER